MVEIALKCHLPKTGVSSSSSTRTRPLRNCPGKKRRDEFSKRIRNLSSLRPPCGGAMEPTSLKRDMSTAPPLTAAVLPPLLVVRSVTLLLPLPCCNAGKRRKVYRLSPVFDDLMANYCHYLLLLLLLCFQQQIIAVSLANGEESLNKPMTKIGVFYFLPFFFLFFFS